MGPILHRHGRRIGVGTSTSHTLEVSVSGHPLIVPKMCGLRCWPLPDSTTMSSSDRSSKPSER